MYKSNIILNVRGSYGESPYGNTLELFTEGSLTEEDGKFIIEYDESAISGIDNIRTRLIIDKENVRLQRKGGFETEFIFSLDNKKMFAAAYDTPYGFFEMSVMPIQVASEVSSEKGHINIEYVINVGDQSAFNKLYIDYRLAELKN